MHGGNPMPSTTPMQRALRESEVRYQTLFDSLDQGVCVLEVIFDADDRPVDYCFLDVNSAFETETGLHDPVGKTARELVPDLDDSWFEIYGQVARTGEPARFENHAPAMERWFEVNAFRLGAPELRQVALLFKDITADKRRERDARLERARAERALTDLTVESERQKRLYETIISNTPDLQYIFDLDYHFVYANDALLKMWGRTWEESRGKRLIELGYEPWHAEMHEREIDTVVATKAPVRGEVPFTGTQGRRIYDYIFVPVIGERGEVEAVAGTTRDITEIKQHQAALIEADRRKDHFLAVLSHELRNPLAPIKNNLYVLDHLQIGEQAHDALEVINRQVDQLARLVNDLLDVTRVKEDKIQLRCERLELNALVRQTAEDHYSLFDERNVGFEVVLSPEPVYVNGDHNRLAQVIGNLLQNAAKFTPSGEHAVLSVHLEPSTKQVGVSVVDTGIGLPFEALATLFEPFVQADTSQSSASQGVGLGLALVKGLVELHGGSVSVSSEGLGKGSRFDVWLPLATSTDERLSPQASAPTAETAPSPRRVLLIDDNFDVASSLRMVLEIKGHEVAVAESGAEGLELARRFKPEIVLCDIGMPDMDGHAVARLIRDDPVLSHTFLVALSGYAMPSDIEKSQAAGFDHHLPKPPALDVLDKLIRDAPAQPRSEHLSRQGEWSNSPMGGTVVLGGRLRKH